MGEVVQPRATQQLASHECASLHRRFEKRDHPVDSHPEQAKAGWRILTEDGDKGFGDRAQADLQGRSFNEEPPHVLGDLLRDRLGRRAAICWEWRLRFHDGVERIERHPRVAVCPRHRRVDFCDHPTDLSGHCQGIAHGRPETHVAQFVGRRHHRQEYIGFQRPYQTRHERAPARVEPHPTGSDIVADGPGDLPGVVAPIPVADRAHERVVADLNPADETEASQALPIRDQSSFECPRLAGGGAKEDPVTRLHDAPDGLCGFEDGRGHLVGSDQ